MRGGGASSKSTSSTDVRSSGARVPVLGRAPALLGGIGRGAESSTRVASSSSGSRTGAMPCSVGFAGGGGGLPDSGGVAAPGAAALGATGAPGRRTGSGGGLCDRMGGGFGGPPRGGSGGAPAPPGAARAGVTGAAPARGGSGGARPDRASPGEATCGRAAGGGVLGVSVKSLSSSSSPSSAVGSEPRTAFGSRANICRSPPAPGAAGFTFGLRCDSAMSSCGTAASTVVSPSKAPSSSPGGMVGLCPALASSSVSPSLENVRLS